MIKNTASQVIGAQILTAADGTAFTGSVTCYVTGDGGSQAAGSVGSGACAHEGNGYHTYTPAQAETNYDLIAFTFTGTGAAPVTIQVFTISGTIESKIDTIDGVVDDILVDTATTIPGTLTTIAGYIDTEVAAILADTDEIQAELANGGRLDLIFDAILADTNDLQTNQGNWATATGFMPDTEDGSSFTALPNVTLANGAHGGAAATITLSDYSDFQEASGLTAEAVRIEMDANSTQLAAIVEDTGTTLPGTLSTISGYIDTEISAILSDTNEIQGDLANGGRLDTIFDSILADTNELQTDDIPGSLATIDSKIDTIDGIVDDILADTDELQTNQGNWATATGFMPDTEDGSSFTSLPAVDLNADQSAVTIGTVTTLTGHTAQTGDSYARLGAPAGASVSADIAAIKSDSGNILTDTGTTLENQLSKLRKYLMNKMEITEANGNSVVYDDDGTTPLISVSSAFSSDSTTTTRKDMYN